MLKGEISTIDKPVQDVAELSNQEIQLAKHHAKVANKRKNTLHEITTYLCKNHAKIVVEDLNVGGMLKNHKLAVW
jgi:putative transposase